MHAAGALQHPSKTSTRAAWQPLHHTTTAGTSQSCSFPPHCCKAPHRSAAPRSCIQLCSYSPLHTRVHLSPLCTLKTLFFSFGNSIEKHFLYKVISYPLTLKRVSPCYMLFPPSSMFLSSFALPFKLVEWLFLFYKISSRPPCFPMSVQPPSNDRHQEHAVLPSHALACSDLPAPPLHKPLARLHAARDGCRVTGEDRRVVPFLFEPECWCLSAPLPISELLWVCSPHLRLCCKHGSCTEPRPCSSTGFVREVL